MTADGRTGQTHCTVCRTETCPICTRTDGDHWRWCISFRPLAPRRPGDEWDPYSAKFWEEPSARAYRAVAASEHRPGWMDAPPNTPRPAAVPDPRFRDQLAEEAGGHGLAIAVDQRVVLCTCGWRDESDDNLARPLRNWALHVADALLSGPLAPLLADQATVKRVEALVAFYDRHEYSALDVDDLRRALDGTQ